LNSLLFYDLLRYVFSKTTNMWH